ncbi:hypothetical protein ACF3NR_08790 [Vaginella massiliensis]|uniref:hypothetical protein n=1 Tax=Vaginella massiliensis TaxID=1816680 RepID=UPI00083843A4|nr:hypothetical protein [Vaginella massiliensis]
MKKIVFVASVLVLTVACNKKPTGNHQVLPVVHEPVEVPSHDAHAAHDTQNSHAKHEEVKDTVTVITKDSVAVKQDTEQAGN